MSIFSSRAEGETRGVVLIAKIRNMVAESKVLHGRTSFKDDAQSKMLKLHRMKKVEWLLHEVNYTLKMFGDRPTNVVSPI